MIDEKKEQEKKQNSSAHDDKNKSGLSYRISSIIVDYPAVIIVAVLLLVAGCFVGIIIDGVPLPEFDSLLGFEARGPLLRIRSSRSKMSAPWSPTSLLVLALCFLNWNSETCFYSQDNEFYITNVSKYVSSNNFISRNPCGVTHPGNRLYNLILACGDVHPRPGPGDGKHHESPVRNASGKKPRRVGTPCVGCSRNVTKKSKAVSCDVCERWTHVRCTQTVSSIEYDRLVHSREDFNFTCDSCAFSCLPFHLDDDSRNQGDEQTQPTLSLDHGNLNDNLFKVFDGKGLHFVHANVRSLLPKMSEIRLLLSRTKAAALAVTETWLDATIRDGEIEVDGYSVIRRDRDRMGGGVALFIKHDVTFNPRPDLEEDGLEMVWGEILLPKTKGILISSCYRPPRDDNFLDRFDSVLSGIEQNKEIFILGDMNICNFRKDSPLFRKYDNVLNGNNCKQMVTEATRITADCSSSLDHLITNVDEKIKKVGVLDFGFSDHLVIFCTRGSPKSLKFASITKRLRSLKNYTSELFCEELAKINWNPVFLADNVDEALSSFVSIFQFVLDKVAPYRDIRPRQRTEPWMTADILAGIRKRDALLSKFKRDKSDRGVYAEFCKLRNEIQRDIKKAKASFIGDKIEASKGDSKKLWSHLNGLGHKNGKSDVNVVLEEGGDKCFEATKVASSFNTFFTSVASNLLSKLPGSFGLYTPSSSCFQDFYRRKGIFGQNFVLSTVSDNFVLDQLMKLDPRKSTGLDNIPSRFLRDGSSHISMPICHIINMSILGETVPSGFKQARVRPLYKKGSKLDPGNYRPISVLCVLSKILERAVHTQLSDYLKSKNLLYEFQSGFRGRYSTDTCLIDLMDFIKAEMSKGSYVGMILIDLQKAFDTVDHGILCRKLAAMGIGSVNWFRSYLSDRAQCVGVNGTQSDFLEVTCGVPQGSILGPILFLCYINDMPISLRCRLALYADDSALVHSGKHPDEIAAFLSNELASCKKWLVDNRLSLHIGKTECILFGSKRRLGKAGDFKVTCGDTLVKRVSSVKYLGVILDHNLGGVEHISSILSKVNSRLSFLYRCASFLNQQTKWTVCLALIQPHLDYCSSAWYSGLSVLLKNKIDIVQRKTARYVLNRGPRDHIGQGEFKSLNWLTVPDRVRFFKMLHMFKVTGGFSPPYLAEKFTPVSEVHGYGTRGSGANFFLPKGVSLGPMSTSFVYTAIKEWNDLPLELKRTSSVDNFKTNLKSYLSRGY
jgi:exonuclease III